MFWKRGKKSEEKEVPELPTEPAAPESDHQSVDVLAGVLRAIGDFAFDFDDTDAETVREVFEGWARHVLVGAPRPGLEKEAEEEDDRREWGALRQFVTDHRRRESDYVVRSLRDLRQVIWIFIQGLGRAVTADRSSDATVSEQLGRLRAAVEDNDTEAVKRIALDSIGLIERLIEERGERHRNHVKTLAGRIEEMSGELSEALEQASLDALTDLPNRAALDEQLERIFDFNVVFGQPAILFMIDIDHFKWVNDKFGHSAGDEVLKEVARELKRGFRRRGDFVARYGGDEFAGIIQDESLEVADRLGERILFAVRDLSVEHPEEPIRVEVSIGVARLLPGDDVASWTQRADRALYAAKEMGRDRIVIDTAGVEASEKSETERPST